MLRTYHSTTPYGENCDFARVAPDALANLLSVKRATITLLKQGELSMRVAQQQHPIARNCRHRQGIRSANRIQLAYRTISRAVSHG